MKKFRIVHLSDLHVGSKARGLDLCTPIGDAEKVGRDKDFVSLFEAWAATEKATADGPFDMLCVTGDISNTANPEEFQIADRAVGRIAKALNLDETSVYFVPGNHDVHWGVLGLHPSQFWAQHRYAPLLQSNLSFARRSSGAAEGRFDTEPYFVCWHGKDASVIAINSAAYDGPTATPHNGFVKQETVEALDRYLSSLSSNPDQLRLCLLHHHVEQYSEPIPDTADFSIAVNAENLVQALAKHQVDLVMHGHKHFPRMAMKQADGKHPLVAVCAGSFSSLLSQPYYEGIQNMFHVINVEGRETTSGRIFGRVDNWVFKDRTWQEASGVGGMYSREAFGSAATPTEVERLVRAGLTSKMSQAPLCQWSDLVQAHPLLDQIRTDVAFDTLKRVSESLGLDMSGDKAIADKKWVVFRRSS